MLFYSLVACGATSSVFNSRSVTVFAELTAILVIIRNHMVCWKLLSLYITAVRWWPAAYVWEKKTSSSAMAERPCEHGDFNGV